MSIKVLTAAQMREVDRITIEQLGVPGAVLMENAGRNVVDVLERRFHPSALTRIAVLCGKGNNGADGFVVARHLRMRGYKPRVALLAGPAELKGDALLNYNLLVQSGLTPAALPAAGEWANWKPRADSATLLVDAILGTGLQRPVDGFLLQVIRDLNSIDPHPSVLAVDIPSGMSSDTGNLIGESVRADLTVTFTAPKWGQVLPPACDRVGELVVTAIGTPSSVYEAEKSIFLNQATSEDLEFLESPRDPNTHKGSYGHVLVVGGSRGKSGAAALAGLAALSSGAGLVTVATPGSVLPLVAAASPVLMTEPLAETEAGTISLRAFDYGRFSAVAGDKSVLAIGPGLSTNPDTVAFVRRVIQEFPQMPTVLDADGLNAFAGSVELLRGDNRTLVLTPHPGEMSRLTGRSTREIQESRVEVARDFAIAHQVCVVLKGHRTLVAEPGGQVYVNPTGNAGMASGGTGDVLTGVIAALLAQQPTGAAHKAVAAAVYWHGAAGDAAARRRGEVSLTATDLLHALPRGLRRRRNPRPRSRWPRRNRA